MFPKLRTQLWHYAAALLAVAVAVALTRCLWPAVDPGISPLFFAAVTFSAWYGGTGPGLLATFAAGLCSAIYITEYERLASFQFGLDDVLRTGVFLLLALLINSLQYASRRASERMREAMMEAEAANCAKDRFIAMLSHELRNPLNPVLMTLSGYDGELPPPDVLRGDLELIRRNVELEARLVDDLLDLARIRNGKLSVKLQRTDVHASLAHALGICAPAIHGRQIELENRQQAGCSWVRGDPARLQQVFWNLLNNAAKFTPPGGRIVVHTRNARTVSGQPSVIVEVCDTGRGIEPEVLPGIFEAFQQGGADVTRRYGGMGLGLAISQALVAAHGGAITAHSQGAGKGALFTVELPLCATAEQPAVPEHPKPASVAPSTAAQPAGCPRILLVEDQEDTLRVMSRLLRRSGYAISAAASVNAALEAAGQQRPDLVVSDIGLPDGTGFDLMRRLRDLYGLRGIALSGLGMETDLRQSEEAGFVEHLVKPVDLPKLDTAIRRTLQRQT